MPRSSTYDNPISISYRVAAASLAATGVVLRFIGPVGRVGRLASLTGVVTTTLTTTAPVIQLGTAATPALIIQKTIALAAANAGFGLTATEEDTVQANSRRLTADTVAQLNVSTAAAAGAADFTIVIDWY